MAKAYTPKPAEVHAANLSTLKERIKNGKPSGAYIFYGDEEYTKNFYYNELLRFCGDRKMNVRTFTSDDFTLADFISACETSAAGAVNMFGGQADDSTETAYRMVRLISPPLEKLTKNDEKYFLSQIEDPDEHTVIVFFLYADETEKLSKGIYKKIADAALPVNFRHETAGSNMLLSWILRHFTKAGIQVDRRTVSYFNNYVGNDMTTLKNELDNCVNFLRYEGRDTLTEADIELVCKKSMSAQIFDISSRALAGDLTSALAAYRVFRESGEKELIVFGTLSKAVNDLCTVERLSRSGERAPEIAKKAGLRDFVVRNYLQVLAKRKNAGKSDYAAYAAQTVLQYDTLLKSSRTDGYALLEELIFKLAVG